MSTSLLTSKSAVQLDVLQSTISPTSYLQGTLNIDLSKIPIKSVNNDQVTICMDIRRIHEKCDVKGHFGGLAISAKEYNMQSSTWTLDASLKAVKIKGKKIKNKQDACAFSLAPAAFSGKFVSEEGHSTKETFIFELIGSLLDSDHLNPTKVTPCERETIILTASLRYGKERKLKLPTWDYSSNIKKSKNINYSKTEYIRGALDRRIISVLKEDEVSKEIDTPTPYHLRRNDVLLHV